MLGGNEGSDSIFEVLHEVEISHGQKSFGILEITLDVIWYSNAIHEVHNCSKDAWGTLVHFENPVVIPNCRVEVLKCPEVLRPGKKI